MKSYICLISLILILSCSEETELNSTTINGKWVTYEIVEKDGSIQVGPFTALGIFGSYSESIQLNPDNTYIPMIRTDTHYISNPVEAGTFTYTAKELHLTSGVWEMEFYVEKLTDTDLWLKTPDITYKLNRVN